MLLHPEIVCHKRKELERFDSCSRYAMDLLTDAFEKTIIKDRTDVIPIATGRFASEVYRIQLNKSGYSSSVIAKIPNHAFMKQNISHFNEVNHLYTNKQLEDNIDRNSKFVSNLHDREVSVYRYATLNFKSNLKIPQFYFGDFAEDDKKHEIIIIEDFTNSCQQTENWTLSVGQVEQIVDEICKLQVETVNDLELEKTFPLLITQLEAMSKSILMSANLFSRRRLPWFTRRILSRIQSMALPQHLKMILLPAEVDLKVLCHGDLETKNMLWQSGNKNLLSLIDWKTSHAGSPLTDLASLIAINLDPIDRRNSELTLIRQFVETWNHINTEIGSKKLSLVETELAYKEALRYGMLKLLVLLVINPEADASTDEFPGGRLTFRLQVLIEDVFGH